MQFRLWIVQHAREVVVTQDERVQRPRELFAIEIAAEVSFVHGHSRGFLYVCDQISLYGLDVIAQRSWTIIEFHRRRDDDATTGASIHAVDEVKPIFHERMKARLASRLVEGWLHDRGDESIHGGLKDRELQRVFSAKVRKKTALRHSDRFCEFADRESRKAFARRHRQRRFENLRAGGSAFGSAVDGAHVFKNSTTVRFKKALDHFETQSQNFWTLMRRLPLAREFVQIEAKVSGPS